ncbi:primosomal protein N' family DNA-binding protein [Hydrogenivirga sp.]
MLFRVLLPNGRTALYSGKWEREESPIGWRVLVPTSVGGTTGVVIGVKEGESEREIIEFPDRAPLLSQTSLSLIDELAADYLLPRGVLLFKLLPSVFLWKEEELLVVSDRKPFGLDRKSLELIEYVKKRRGVKPHNLKKRYDPALVKLLTEKGFLRLKREWRAPELEESYYRLALPLKEALKKVRSKEKRRLLVFVSGKESVGEEELLSWGFRRRDLRELVKKGLLTSFREIRLKPSGATTQTPLKKITGDRELLWADFEFAAEDALALAQHNLRSGRSTLIIFPDYGELTAFLGNLPAELGDRLVEIHSRVPSRKLYEGWFRATREPSLVVGTYLSLLCPLRNLSSVVLFDESSNGVKLRHAGGIDLRRAVFLLSRKRGATLQMSTPAPSLSSFYLVSEGRMGLRRELKRSPEVNLIRREPTEVLTEELYFKLRELREKKILFLVPKHGYSYVYCPRCEALAECPECGTLLTYSLKRESLYCTNCRYKREELTCPECEGGLEEVGFGLEKAMEVVEENFGLKENFHFSTHPHWEHPYDVVVVLSADSILSVPSYRAEEELFTYLLRAKNVAGESLFIQSILPEEKPFQSVKENKLEEFYREELEEKMREELPPFWRLLLIKSKNPELEKYIFKVVTPNVRSTYNVREDCYELLLRFKERKTLWKVRQLLKRFPRDIIEVRVDPF